MIGGTKWLAKSFSITEDEKQLDEKVLVQCQAGATAARRSVASAVTSALTNVHEFAHRNGRNGRARKISTDTRTQQKSGFGTPHYSETRENLSTRFLAVKLR